MSTKYNFKSIEKYLLRGSKLIPNVMRVTSKDISIPSNVVESLKGSVYVRESGSEALDMGLSYDKKHKAMKLYKTDDPVKNFVFTICPSGVGRLFQPKAFRESGMPKGDYVRVGTSLVFKLAE